MRQNHYSIKVVNADFDGHVLTITMRAKKPKPDTQADEADKEKQKNLDRAKAEEELAKKIEEWQEN